MFDYISDYSLSSLLNFSLTTLVISAITSAIIFIPWSFYKKSRHENITQLKTKVLFITYLIALFIITIYRFGNTNEYADINIIPFKLLIESYQYSVSDNPQMALPVLLYNVIGNIIWFIPMGFFLAYFMKSNRFIRVCILCLLISVWIETIQYLLVVGISDIDDVIFNTIGGIIGFCIYQIAIKKGIINDH